MSNTPRMTHEEIVNALLTHALDDLTSIDTEQSFYRYVDGHLEFIEPELNLPALIATKIIELKADGILPPYINPTPPLVSQIITMIRWFCKHRLQSVDSQYLAFNDNMLIDTSSADFTPTPIARDKPAFIYFPYPHTILQDDTPPTMFLSFLNNTFDHDQDMILFIQQMIGYCLLDSIEAHAVFFLLGQGQNGKSQLLKIIKSLLPPSLINADKLQDLTSNRFRMANLVGKRLNIAGEEESKYLNADIFKAISSGETISAERKFQGPFKFEPKVKLIYATQKVPTFDAVDKAMRRRLFIIPFDNIVKDKDKIPFLAEKIIAKEHAQIISWALQGARHVILNKFHFNRPKKLDLASRKQEETTSSSIQFFNDNFLITKEPNDTYPRSFMYSIYTYWCDEERRKPVSRQRFFTELSQRYEEEGLQIPDKPTWDQKTKTTSRVLLGLKPTDDQTAFVHQYGKPTVSSLPTSHGNAAE